MVDPGTALTRSVAAHLAESRVLGLGRTILALAQASILLFTPASYLFVPVGPHSGRPDCGGARALSAFCVAGGDDLQVVSWVLLALLLVIASGLLPRYLSVVHFWISISLGQSLSLPDGGESVAHMVTFFLVLASANDRRRWHWQAAGTPDRESVWQGLAWAGSLGLRAQVAFIYIDSSVSKLMVDAWTDGSATYYVARMESFGAAGVGAGLVRLMTEQPIIVLALSWGSIALELLIAWFLLAGSRRHPVALAAAVALHLGILLQLGIVSFALVMIGAVTCAAAGGVEQLLRRYSPHASVTDGDDIGGDSGQASVPPQRPAVSASGATDAVPSG